MLGATDGYEYVYIKNTIIFLLSDLQLPDVNTQNAVVESLNANTKFRNLESLRMHKGF